MLWHADGADGYIPSTNLPLNFIAHTPNCLCLSLLGCPSDTINATCHSKDKSAFPLKLLLFCLFGPEFTISENGTVIHMVPKSETWGSYLKSFSPSFSSHQLPFIILPPPKCLWTHSLLSIHFFLLYLEFLPHQNNSIAPYLAFFSMFCTLTLSDLWVFTPDCGSLV